jgi:hypothetical protein
VKDDKLKTNELVNSSYIKAEDLVTRTQEIYHLIAEKSAAKNVQKEVCSSILFNLKNLGAFKEDNTFSAVDQNFEMQPPATPMYKTSEFKFRMREKNKEIEKAFAEMGRSITLLEELNEEHQLLS